MSSILKSALFLLVMMLFGTASAQKTGVLIMAHGGSKEWNQYVEEAAQPLSADYEVAYAWGMANPVTLQQGINKLEEKGVKRIIAVPLFISSHSPIIRQTEYLFGKRDTLADRAMPLMHHSEHFVKMFDVEVDSSHYKYGMLFPPHLPQLNTESDIVMTHALDAHDVVADILAKRIGEMSDNPSNETVLIVAHGPNSEADNNLWIQNMENLILKIQDKQEQKDGKFKQMFALTVRDDAPKPVFNQAKEQLRTMVRQAGLSGDVIVVPLFLSSGGREQAIAERMEGLDYKWTGKTLLPDPLLTDFLENSVNSAAPVQ